MDALGRKRSQPRDGSSLRGVVNQVPAELDGVGTDNEGLFVLAAGGHPWDIDSALLRPGRLDRAVLVLPPDAGPRGAALWQHPRGRPTERLDLALMCEQATETAVEESMASGRSPSAASSARLSGRPAGRGPARAGAPAASRGAPWRWGRAGS